jgi:sigma-B regulation protein RsbU (phosphoserine phosphatase)
MLFRAGGTVELKATGPVVGLIEVGKFEQCSVVLSASDAGRLLRRDQRGDEHDDEEWGEPSGASAQAAFPCTAHALIDRLFVAADAFAAGAVQHDDMTVVVVSMTS